jgi:hypothetical protein
MRCGHCVSLDQRAVLGVVGAAIETVPTTELIRASLGQGRLSFEKLMIAHQSAALPTTRGSRRGRLATSGACLPRAVESPPAPIFTGPTT